MIFNEPHSVNILTFIHSLEIYFRDGRSLLIIFSDQKHRQNVTKSLDAIIKQFNAEPPTPGLLKSPSVIGLLSDRSSMNFGVKIFAGLQIDELSTAQRKWQAREISNVSRLVSCVHDMSEVVT